MRKLRSKATTARARAPRPHLRGVTPTIALVDSSGHLRPLPLPQPLFPALEAGRRVLVAIKLSLLWKGVLYLVPKAQDGMRIV